MMEKRGNDIYITSKAKQLLELVPEDLKKPELTADWEMKLSDIACGKLRQDKFLTGIREYACEIVDEIKSGQGTFRHDNMTNKKCPNCGKHLLAVNGKMPVCWCVRTESADTGRLFLGQPMRAARNATSVWRCF